MPAQPRSRRTLLPLVLLLAALVGVGPFVPQVQAASAPAAAAFDIPGLAGWLGVALAIAALAGIAIARRREPRTAPRAPRDPGTDGREIDPLVAALRGPAAYAPDDLDARLGTRTSVGAPQSSGEGPIWVRRIDPRRDERRSPDGRDASAGWQRDPSSDLARR